MANRETASDVPPLLSVEEYASLPEELNGDLVRGRLVREPRPGGRHGALVTVLARELDLFARGKAAGRVIAEGGFLLESDPPTVRGPDVAFVRADRLGAGLPRGFIEGAPDLAVEILSPTTSGPELREKTEEYLRAGARLVWIVDPERRSVVVRRADGARLELRGDDVLEGEPVLPGFRLPLAVLFEDLD